MTPFLDGPGAPKLLYVPPGSAEPSLWMRIYKRFEDEDRLRGLMWFQQGLPEAERVSERTFLKLADEAPAVLIGTVDDFLGVAWFTNIAEHRAHMSICYCRGVPSTLSVACTQAAICLAGNLHGWEEIWAETPWPWARAHAERAGAETIATFPAYVTHDGTRWPLYILRGYVHHARDALQQQSTQPLR